MAQPPNQMPLPGSALATPSAPCRGPLDPLTPFDLVIRLRRPARAEDVAEVIRFAVDAGLRVLDADQRAATVALRGSVLAAGRAFGVELRAYAGPEGSFRGRRGVVHIPVTLAGIVVAVDGLDERPGTRHRPAAPRDRRPVPPRPSPSLPVSAAPRVRAGRSRPESAGDTGSGLAVVLRIPSRDVPAPLGDEPRPVAGAVGARPTSLAAARAHRRGPLVRAAADQRDRRLARALHPSRGDT